MKGWQVMFILQTEPSEVDPLPAKRPDRIGAGAAREVSSAPLPLVFCKS